MVLAINLNCRHQYAFTQVWVPVLVFFVQTTEKNTYKNTATQAINSEKERNKCDSCVFSMELHHKDGCNSVCLIECWRHAKFYLQRKQYTLNSWLNDNADIV